MVTKVFTKAMWLNWLPLQGILVWIMCFNFTCSAVLAIANGNTQQSLATARGGAGVICDEIAVGKAS
jgi:succinate-acetate transporter protein